MQPLLRELQQQTERVAIRTDRMRTGLPLLHQTLGEEPFQQGSEAGRGGHGLTLPASLEAAHRLVHQLRPGTEVPIRIADVDMAEVGRQEGQASLGILTGAVPAQQRLHRESMTEVVKTRPMTVRWTAQTDLPG